jgi:hypothetical protein
MTPSRSLLLATLLLAACGDDPKPPASQADMGDMDTRPDLASDMSAPADMSADMPEDMSADLSEDMPAAGPATLRMRLTRGQDKQILVSVDALDAQGQPADAQDVVLGADQGMFGPPDLSVPGTLSATLTPPDGVQSASIVISASIMGQAPRIERTALVLPQLADHWGQPEAVPGLVNTPGWEDSLEISPDGQWLIVGTYSPVNLFACQLSGQRAMPPVPYGLPDAPECNAAPGPYDAPARPGMPGASRIMPGKIHHTCPSVGISDPMNPDADFLVALPPVAAYGFKRLADDTFGEPFLIAFTMDGCTVGPFGFTFPEGSFDAAHASMAFSFDDYRNDGPLGDTHNDLFIVRDVALGAPINLGTYMISGGQLGVTDFKPARLAIPDEGGEGNPFVAREGVFFDNEGGEDIDIFFSRATDLSEDPLSARERVGISAVGSNDYQPFVYADRLYYARDFQQLRSARWTDRAKVDASAFEGDGVELAAGLPTVQTPGAILAIGEPSLARDADGVEWLYFVYAARDADGGINQETGRVRRKP